MRAWRCVGWILAVVTSAAQASPIDDLVRIHHETIGGELLAACRAITAKGTVSQGGKELRFDLIAARPNRVRLTIHAGERTLTQATDGVSPPWQADSAKGRTTEEMALEDAREFMADAEFDDPIVSGAARGYVIDYAGEITWQGRRVIRVLVTRSDSAPSFLLLDPETYFILARLTKRLLPSGREVSVETRYEDFRPVGGVIYAHRITVLIEGVVVRQTLMGEIRGVDEPGAELFARPLLAAAESKTATE